MKAWILLSVLALGFAGAATAADLTFDDAVRPYENLAYDANGHVRKSGTLYVPGKLGCSGFASAVLQRMYYGTNWLNHPKYKHELYQWRGDRIAAHFGIDLSAHLAPKQLQAAGVLELLQAGVLKTNGLYLFNVTAPTRELDGAWTTLGHVGFVRVKADGTLEQRHFSGMSNIDGLARGSFVAWHSASAYREAATSLYSLDGK